MRRGIAVLALVIVILAGIGIGVSSYNAGVDEGIRRGADAGQVVQVVGGYHGFGFFPFGLFLFPLLLFGFFALARGRHRHGSWGPGPGPWGHGPWGEEGRGRFEEKAREWHQQQHEPKESTDTGASMV